MTLKIYTKVKSGTKWQALEKLSYGQATIAPGPILGYPGNEPDAVQNGLKLVTDEPTRKAN